MRIEFIPRLIAEGFRRWAVYIAEGKWLLILFKLRRCYPGQFVVDDAGESFEGLGSG